MRSRLWVLCLVVIVLFVSATLMGADDASAFQNGKASQQGKKDKPGGGGGKPTATIDVLQLTFNDTATQGAGASRIVSDWASTGAVTYTDRRIPGVGETCVTARFTSGGGGGTFVHLDSGQNSAPLVNDCNAQVSDPLDPNFDENRTVPRTYVLEFDDTCSCEVLFGPGSGPFCSMTVDVGPNGAARISTSSLFRKKDKTATIDLMFRVLRHPELPEPDRTEAFVISSDNPLRILPDDDADPDVRRLESDGEGFGLTSLENGFQCPVTFSLSIDFRKFSVEQGGS